MTSLIVSGAFIVNTIDGYGVILVQRSGNTNFTGKWALLPTGVVEPNEHIPTAFKRETEEELLITYKGKIINPIIESTFILEPELYEDDYNKDKIFIIRSRHLTVPLEEIVIQDGETSEYQVKLNRLVSVVNLSDNLNGEVTPLAMFQTNQRITPYKIDLSGYQTPTLEWLRQNKEKILRELNG